MAHAVRYHMHWGHKVSGKDGQIEVTRADYNMSFGVEVPEPPEIPDCAVHAWELWGKLSARRPASEGVCPLSPEMIESYCRVTGETVDPDDYRMIEAMDDAYISEVGKERKAMFDRDQERSKAKKGKR